MKVTVTRADCGHFVALTAKPNAQDAQGRQLVLCQSCLASANAKKKPRIEVKA